MPEIHVSMPDLQRRALQEVRKQPGCHNVQEIAINRVAKHDEYNSSLYVLAARAADADTAARAAVHVQTVLRRDYDLLTDLICWSARPGSLGLRRSFLMIARRSLSVIIKRSESLLSASACLLFHAGMAFSRSDPCLTEPCPFPPLVEGRLSSKTTRRRSPSLLLHGTARRSSVALLCAAPAVPAP